MDVAGDHEPEAAHGRQTLCFRPGADRHRGEQPGHEEDLAGRPFVGPAGRLLDRALAEAGFDRRQLYITNAVKHFDSDRSRAALIAEG